MRGGFLTLIFLLANFGCRAEWVAENPIGSNRFEIVWNVTNSWPRTVWIYKVVPQNFPPAVISNLMAITSFTEANRAPTALGSERKDNKLLYFTNKKQGAEKRELGISPKFGLIQYRDNSSEGKSKEDATNIPSNEETLQLALDCLRQIGIDRSHLATKQDSTELKTFKLEETGRRLGETNNADASRVISRGLFFIRKIDGIDFDGIGPRGGVQISFGKNGKINRLEVIWKGLEPFILRNTLSKAQIIDAIHAGKVEWSDPSPNPDGIKKITITGIRLLYHGEENQKYVEPYAELTTLVDYGFTNIVVNLGCPIVGK